MRFKVGCARVALNTILPNWVERTGGPDSDAVNLYNEKVAPIVGVTINPDGSAKELSGATMTSGETKLVSQGENIEIQLVCINRTGNPCTLIYSTEEEHGIGRLHRASSGPHRGPG